MTKVPRRDKIFVPVINFLIRVLTSKQYQKRLHAFMGLGHLKAAELIAQRKATDAKVAKEPGMAPDGTIVPSEDETKI